MADDLGVRMGGIGAVIAGFLPEEADRGLLRDRVAEAREVERFAGPPVCVHGDLHGLNRGTLRGRVSRAMRRALTRVLAGRGG